MTAEGRPAFLATAIPQMPRNAGKFAAFSRSYRAGPRQLRCGEGGASVSSERCGHPLKRLASFFRRGLVYWLPLVLLLAAVAAHVELPRVFDRLSLFAFDVYERAVPRETPADPPVVIVDIDERSL